MITDSWKKEIGQEIIEFVDSSQFKQFELIIEQLYLMELNKLHNLTDTNEILSLQKKLNVYANLPEDFKSYVSNELANRKALRDKE